MARVRKIGASMRGLPVSGSQLATVVAGFVIVGLCAGLIASSVIFNNRINDITYTNYTWIVSTLDGQSGFEHVIEATNNGTLLIQRVFTVQKFPTYQRLTLGLFGFLSSENDASICSITFLNAIEPPYTYPFDPIVPGQPLAFMIGNTILDPVTSNGIKVSVLPGGRNVTIAFLNPTPSSLVFSSPQLLSWTLFNDGSVAL
jgi:hypothetical protein